MGLTYNQLTDAQRREADRSLWQLAKLARKDKSLDKKARKAARRIAAIFWLRLFFKSHKPAGKFLQKASRPFNYGYYCGPGMGVPSGETRQPRNYLDCGCKQHDVGKNALDCYPHKDS